MNSKTDHVFKVGDPVVVFRRGDPIRVSQIAKVRTRLGKITSYELADTGRYGPGGYSTASDYNLCQIKPATDAHLDAIKTRRLAYALTTRHQREWEKLPLETLAEIVRLAGVKT
jgi:hypothetical protein